MRSKWLGSLVLSSVAVAALVAQSPAKRPVRVGDLYRLKNVAGVELSPDGKWVAYTVATTDSAKDRVDTDVWMTAWDGSRTIQVTSTPERETSPKFSPDGRYLSFLSARQNGHGSQLWLLDREGGEARRITELKTGVMPGQSRMVAPTRGAPRIIMSDVPVRRRQWRVAARSRT